MGIIRGYTRRPQYPTYLPHVPKPGEYWVRKPWSSLSMPESARIVSIDWEKDEIVLSLISTPSGERLVRGKLSKFLSQWTLGP